MGLMQKSSPRLSQADVQHEHVARLQHLAAAGQQKGPFGVV